jgi:hypothetical protein
LRHHVSLEKRTASIQEMLRRGAENERKAFEALLMDAAAFAAKSDAGARLSHTKVSVNVKSLGSIVLKAQRKYDGDVFQVKDILRGQIWFPDEASLVCGLIFMFRVGTLQHSDSSNQMKLCRMKNLLSFDTTGATKNACLPTGYRHILLNLRLQSGLLAGEMIFSLVV